MDTFEKFRRFSHAGMVAGLSVGLVLHKGEHLPHELPTGPIELTRPVMGTSTGMAIRDYSVGGWGTR